MNDRLQIAEAVLREVAADDLADRPVYIIDTQEPGAERFRDPGPRVLAWTSRAADLQARSFLRAANRWQGRGFCCIVHTERLGSLPSLIGTCLHELAHWLSWPMATDTEVDERVEREPLPRWFLDWAATAKVEPPPAAKPWHGHGQQFVRACSVLSTRVESVMEAVRPRFVNFGEHYFGHPFTETTWLSTLRDEVVRPGSIREILADEPPKAFKRAYKLATGEADE